MPRARPKDLSPVQALAARGHARGVSAPSRVAVPGAKPEITRLSSIRPHWVDC